MHEKKQIVKSTDWLTKGYSEEEIARIKAEAVEEAEKEIRNKQIEEMAKALYDIVNARRGKASMWDLANDLYNAGYRKQREGEWKEVYRNNQATVYECTNCNHLSFGISDYCICGAKMKGGAE